MRAQERTGHGEIRTARLLLRPATAELLRADLEGRDALSAALGVPVADDWPPDAQYDAAAVEWVLRALERDPAAHGWLMYYFIRIAPKHAIPKLIGGGGFKGRPDATGMVEIGYAVVESERRHGYATEASAGLLARAFADPTVHRVAAETLPELIPSIGVMEKLGMKLIGPGSEEGVIRYEIERAAFEALAGPLRA